MNLRPTLLMLSPPVKCDVPSGLVLDSYPGVGFIEPDDYELYHDLH